MSVLFRPRIWFFLVALSCAALIGYGLYVQHVDFLDPCPLCILQRLVFIFIGAVGLVAALHNPGKAGRLFYGLLIALAGAVGMAIAGRHVWLQNLPLDEVPDCGMGLNYMIDTMPILQVLSEVFYGSGECAEIGWTFLGFSMPVWTFIWYAGYAVVTIAVVIAANKSKA